MIISGTDPTKTFELVMSITQQHSGFNLDVQEIVFSLSLPIKVIKPEPRFKAKCHFLSPLK